jgi:hypothetical protein
MLLCVNRLFQLNRSDSVLVATEERFARYNSRAMMLALLSRRFCAIAARRFRSAERKPLCYSWLWIGNKNLRAVMVVLLLCYGAFATTLVTLVSGNAIVFGADGKGVDAGVYDSHIASVGSRTFEKIAVLQNRIIVSTSGIGRILGIYDFNAWIESLPIAENTSVENAATVIKKKCAPIFTREWDFELRHGGAPALNLSGDKSLPIVSYYVGGNEFSGPMVYSVEIYVDWANNRLKAPSIKLLFPPAKGATKIKNTFIWPRGAKNGGMAQLMTAGSDIQRRYLKLYDREVGALIYDELLNVDALGNLAKILLTLEITTKPKLFSFPIKVCSVIPGQRPSCNVYDH